MKKCLLLITTLAAVGAFAVPALVKEATFWLDASTLAEPVGAKLERWADPRGAEYPVATSYMDCPPQVIEIAEGPLKGKRAVDFHKIHTRCDMQFPWEYRIKTAFFVVDLDSDWNAFLLCNNGETEYPFARGTGGTDPAVTIDCFTKGRELAVRTARGPRTEGGFVPYETIRAESLAQWKAFWNEGARVTVPDPVPA